MKFWLVRHMDDLLIRDGLIALLTQSYEARPGQFLTVPKSMLDSSFARIAIADLRNDGYVEEQMRGVIRLTSVGYMQYKKLGKDAFYGPRFPLAV